MNRAKFKRLAKKSLELEVKEKKMSEPKPIELFMGEDGEAHMAVTKEMAEEFLGAKIIVQEEEK